MQFLKNISQKESLHYTRVNIVSGAGVTETDFLHLVRGGIVGLNFSAAPDKTAAASGDSWPFLAGTGHRSLFTNTESILNIHES